MVDSETESCRATRRNVCKLHYKSLNVLLLWAQWQWGVGSDSGCKGIAIILFTGPPFYLLMFIFYEVSVSSAFPICLIPVGLTWAGLCSPKMAAIRASGTVTPPPGETGLLGLSGLMLGDGITSGETSRSFLAAEQGERLRVWASLERGQRLRPCRDGRGLDVRAGTAGLWLRRWQWWCLLVLGLGLREFGASRTKVLSSSELKSELSERRVVGLWTGILIYWGWELNERRSRKDTPYTMYGHIQYLCAPLEVQKEIVLVHIFMIIHYRSKALDHLFFSSFYYNVHCLKCQCRKKSGKPFVYLNCKLIKVVTYADITAEHTLGAVFTMEIKCFSQHCCRQSHKCVALAGCFAFTCLSSSSQTSSMTVLAVPRFEAYCLVLFFYSSSDSRDVCFRSLSCCGMNPWLTRRGPEGIAWLWIMLW